jgi:hypothetical protein
MAAKNKFTTEQLELVPEHRKTSVVFQGTGTDTADWRHVGELAAASGNELIVRLPAGDIPGRGRVRFCIGQAYSVDATYELARVQAGCSGYVLVYLTLSGLSESTQAVLECFSERCATTKRARIIA